MKRIHLISVAALVIVAALVVAIYLPGGISQSGHVDGEKLVAASRAFSRDLQARGAVVPESVSIDELIRKGYLSRDAVRGFDGMKVTVTLHPDVTDPGRILVHVKMPDGEETAAMGDGSIQQVRRPKEIPGLSPHLAP